jgi:HD-like signal output (HDOD) protein
MPLMLRRFPDYLTTLAEADEAGLDRVVMENRRHGCSHALVGALLGRNWGMPRELIAATRAHHKSEALISAREDMQGLSPTLIAIGHVAEDLVDQRYGEQTVVGKHTAQTSAIYLELEPHDLLEVREALEVAIEEREPFLQRQTFNQSH